MSFAIATLYSLFVECACFALLWTLRWYFVSQIKDYPLSVNSCIFINRNNNIIRLFVTIYWYCYSLSQELSWPIFIGWYAWSLACHWRFWLCIKQLQNPLTDSLTQGYFSTYFPVSSSLIAASISSNILFLSLETITMPSPSETVWLRVRVDNLVDFPNIV